MMKIENEILYISGEVEGETLILCEEQTDAKETSGNRIQEEG